MLPDIILQGTVDSIVVAEEDLGNHGRTAARDGQASRCLHCCVSRITEVDGQSSQRMHLSECPTTPGRHECKLVNVLTQDHHIANNLRRSSV